MALADFDVAIYQESIRRDGFAIVPNMVPAAAVAAMREAVARDS